MGWKASYLIINTKSNSTHQEICRDLGFPAITPIDDAYFESVVNPYGKQIFFGEYKGNTIIANADIPPMMVEDTTLDMYLGALTKHYPNAEICALVLHSVVDLWMYTVIKDGIPLRARAGAADEGIMIDEGKLLPEEQTFYDQSTVDENGVRTFNIGGYNYNEQALGEELVFELHKRYTGHRLDMDDELLFETKLTGYSY